MPYGKTFYAKRTLETSSVLLLSIKGNEKVLLLYGNYLDVGICNSVNFLRKNGIDACNVFL